MFNVRDSHMERNVTIMKHKLSLFLAVIWFICLFTVESTGKSDRRYSFNYPYNYPYGYRYSYDNYPRTQDVPTRTIPYDYGYYPYRHRYVHTDDYDPYRNRYQPSYDPGKSDYRPQPSYDSGKSDYRPQPSYYRPSYETGKSQYKPLMPEYPRRPYYDYYGYQQHYNPPSYTPRNYGYPYGYRYQSEPYYPQSKKQTNTYRRSYVETKVIGPETFPGRYLGPGKINMLNGGRDVELVCEFSTTSNVVSNTVWTKIEGSSPNTYSDRPPYYCPDCPTTFLDFDDYRYSSQELPGSSVVRIRDVRPADRGVFRCVGSAQTTPSGNIETVYRVIEFL